MRQSLAWLRELHTEAGSFAGRIGQGATGLLEDPRRTLDELLAHLREAQAQLRRQAQRASEELGAGAERALGTIEGRLQATLETLNLPSRRDIEHLGSAIARLEAVLAASREDVPVWLEQVRADLRAGRELLAGLDRRVAALESRCSEALQPEVARLGVCVAGSEARLKKVETEQLPEIQERARRTAEELREIRAALDGLRVRAEETERRARELPLVDE